ncbi:MAG: hypothetical protein K1W22_14540 [Lachnospiraceae bacterium]
MRKKQRVIAMLMAATLIGGSLSGCGGNGKENEGAASGSGDKVEISFWTQDSTTYMGWFKEAVEKFNAQSDTVEVKAEYFPNFSDKLSQAFSLTSSQTWRLPGRESLHGQRQESLPRCLRNV